MKSKDKILKRLDLFIKDSYKWDPSEFTQGSMIEELESIKEDIKRIL